MTDLSNARFAMLETVATQIVARHLDHPVRVAIDGPDGAGTTVFADELADFVRKTGRPVIRASIDGFHSPRAERSRRGELSPIGYFEDSFDYDSLCSLLLAPFGPNGDRRYHPADRRGRRRAGELQKNPSGRPLTSSIVELYRL